MAEIETEAKLTLLREDYLRLREALPVQECREQLNIYLHDPNRLHEGLGYLRVRFETRREPVVTLKVPRGWDGEVREMWEVEEPLHRFGPGLFPRPRRRIEVAMDLTEEMAEHFSSMGITHLRRLGWMRNHRCLVEEGDQGLVELDRTELPGGIVHFEVEVETADQNRMGALLARIRELAPSASASRVGKFSRFLEAIPGLSAPSRSPNDADGPVPLSRAACQVAGSRGTSARPPSSAQAKP
jgi:uncharacterized protein YjbK